MALFVLVLSLLALAATVSSKSLANAKPEWKCERIDRCTCRDSRTGEIISLHALSSETGPAFHVRDRERSQYNYYYDPCNAFTRSGAGQCEDVAVCQADKDKPFNYNLGFGNTAYFETNFSSLAVTYSGGPYDKPCSPSRVSNTTVYLQCDKDGNASTTKFRYFSEAPLGEFFFSLTSKCACPGGCPGPDRPTCHIDGPKRCSCLLSSRGEYINLESLDKPSTPLTDTSGKYKIFFNPCSGIASGGCTGSTACVYSLSDKTYTSYGSPETGNFSVDVHGNVSLTYQTRLRNSSIRLVCDYAERQAPKFSVVSQSPAELVMEMRYICACPGECLRPPVVCRGSDACSCTLSGDLGEINLHDLDNPVAPLRVRALDQSGSWDTYYYNPCSAFSVQGSQDNCEGVAACQVESGSRDWSLGTQNTVVFHVAQTESHDVSLVYTGGTGNRQVTVHLRCNETLDRPKLTFNEENPMLTYSLLLEAKEACPHKSTTLQAVRESGSKAYSEEEGRMEKSARKLRRNRLSGLEADRQL